MDEQEVTIVKNEAEDISQSNINPSYDELVAQLKQLKDQYNKTVAQYTRLLELYNNLFNAYITK